jgi:biopolymer transport protein ExbB
MSDAVSYWIVKGTLGLLVLFSALTWTVVLVKALQAWRLSKQNKQFAERVGKLSRLPSAETLKQQAGPAARVAQAGLAVWDDASGSVSNPSDEIDVRRDLLERELRRQIQLEKRGAEGGLAVLASIGTTSPFVGLFGTVVGIIHALGRISALGSASLDVVAGPIGEALVATGFGIAVAVPAVLAYNVFVKRVKGLTGDLDDLAASFTNGAVIGTLSNATELERSHERSIPHRREATA